MSSKARWFRGIHEETVHHCRELVARGAVNQPVGWQLLVGAKNLLDDDVTARLDPQSLKPPEVFGWIEQAVHVIDPESRCRAARDEIEHEAMDLVEHDGVFHLSAASWFTSKKRR